MKIQKIRFEINGYVNCKSNFYSSGTYLKENFKYGFSAGINKLVGEIDSDVWAVSYLLSMYKYRPKDFVLFNPAEITVNDTAMPIKDFSKYTCYLDNELYPLFSTKTPIRKLILKGLKQNKTSYSAAEIKEMFYLDSQRFERPLALVGNEVFRAMSAVACSYGKEVFCFPWMSQSKFEYLNKNMTGLLDILEGLNKIVIVPVGKN